MKITVLIENTLPADYEPAGAATAAAVSGTHAVSGCFCCHHSDKLKCEHGLSLLIEYDGRKYLLDAGSSSAFLDNAKILGMSLEDIDTCILSHGHYDHSGGFFEFLNRNLHATVHAMEGATNRYYSAKGGMHEIGIPRQVTDSHADRSFHFIKDIYTPAPNVYLIPHSTKGLEAIGRRAGLFKEHEGSLVPDDFKHELSLVFDTDMGLIIFNSCSHAGIVNILNEVKSALPGRNLYAFVGGLHMEGKKDGRSFCTFSETEIKEIADTLNNLGIQMLFTGHCTGNDGFLLLKKYLGSKVVSLTSGMRIELLA